MPMLPLHTVPLPSVRYTLGPPPSLPMLPLHAPPPQTLRVHCATPLTVCTAWQTLPGPEASDEVDGDKAQLQLNRAEASAAVRLLRAKSASGTPIVLLGYSWG